MFRHGTVVFALLIVVTSCGVSLVTAADVASPSVVAQAGESDSGQQEQDSGSGEQPPATGSGATEEEPDC